MFQLHNDFEYVKKKVFKNIYKTKNNIDKYTLH